MPERVVSVSWALLGLCVWVWRERWKESSGGVAGLTMVGVAGLTMVGVAGLILVGVAAQVYNRISSVYT